MTILIEDKYNLAVFRQVVVKLRVKFYTFHCISIQYCQKNIFVHPSYFNLIHISATVHDIGYGVTQSTDQYPQEGLGAHREN